MTIECPQCGADLMSGLAQEVCYTLTSQAFTLAEDCDPSNEICIDWDNAEIYFEAQKECFIECRDCEAIIDGPALDSINDLRRNN